MKGSSNLVTELNILQNSIEENIENNSIKGFILYYLIDRSCSLYTYISIAIMSLLMEEELVALLEFFLKDVMN